ncbi:MAG TPA: hypothetical protein VHQ20_02810, partial [Patescibacteria group bacterium]|nr:hypothetical protein [Patescibacteria group bacterium]
MKKFIYSVVMVAGFAFYVAFQGRVTKTGFIDDAGQRVVAPASLNINTNSSSNSNKNTNSPITIPTAPPVSAGKYKDGTYTGSVADAYYGNIQVKAIISGGKITDVIFLQ